MKWAPKFRAAGTSLHTYMGSHNLLGPDTLGGCSTALKASRRERQTQKVFLLFWNVGGRTEEEMGERRRKMIP